MKKYTLLALSIFFLSSSVFAKTVITLTKSSHHCSVAFESKKDSQRINDLKYLRFRIDDIKLSDLTMSKGSLESSVDSQWLNAGEKYYISAYINHSIGPKHIPIVISEKESGNRDDYVDINIDEYLPCGCFKGPEKPQRCFGQSHFQLHYSFQKYSNWQKQKNRNAHNHTRNNGIGGNTTKGSEP